MTAYVVAVDRFFKTLFVRLSATYRYLGGSASGSRATVWMKELLARREATGGNGSGAQPRGQERPEPTHSTSQALLPSPGALNKLAGERDRSLIAGKTKGFARFFIEARGWVRHGAAQPHSGPAKNSRPPAAASTPSSHFFLVCPQCLSILRNFREFT